MFNEECIKNLDLEKNGLINVVNKNIEKNRKSTVRVTVTDKKGLPITLSEVCVKQTQSSFRFGCNAFMLHQFDTAEENARYEDLFCNLFNQAVLPFYWCDDEPTYGKYRFSVDSPKIYRRPAPDEILEFCNKHDIEPKAHNLLWNNEGCFPKWLPASPEKRWIEIERRFNILSEKYKNTIKIWDVCNEVAGTGEYERMIPDYEVKAHILADKLFPHCHLIMNDFAGIYGEKYNKRRSNFYLYIKKVILGGGRVDGIGLQNHLFFKKEEMNSNLQQLNAEHILEAIDVYSEFGKDLHISEITIPSYGYKTADLELQAKITENLYRIWFSSKNIKSIVWWNMVDNTASINPLNPSWNENYYYGGLVSDKMEKKPVYDVIKKLRDEWTTDFKTVTDKNGSFCEDFYHGDYELEINGAKFKFSVDENTKLVKLKV